MSYNHEFQKNVKTVIFSEKIEFRIKNGLKKFFKNLSLTVKIKINPPFEGLSES